MILYLHLHLFYIISFYISCCNFSKFIRAHLLKCLIQVFLYSFLIDQMLKLPFHFCLISPFSQFLLLARQKCFKMFYFKMFMF